MLQKFKDIPKGMFRGRHGLVYTKISDTQAVAVMSGNIVDFLPDEEVYSCVSE